MHDFSYFRNNFEQIAERLATRGPLPQLDQFRELDQKRRSAISAAESRKATANEKSTEIGQLRRQGSDTSKQQEEVRTLKAEIAALDEQVKALDEPFRELLAGIPNIPHESVPVGKTEA